jgi:hypothetical protein
MNNLFTSKGRVILFSLLICHFGLNFQAKANTRRMVSDTDTLRKAPVGRIIKSDTTLLLKAGTQITTNADTIVIVNGVPTKISLRKPGVTDPSANGVTEVKNNDSTKISIMAPPTNGTIQVKNTATAPPINTSIVSPPSDGVIQVKDGNGNPADGTNPGNGSTPGSNGNAANGTDPAAAGKSDAAGKTDAAGNASKSATDPAIGSPTTTDGQPINREIQVKNGDTTLTKKTDTLLMKKDTAAMAQDTTDASEIKAKGYYLEVGGPGLAISANYDSRFGKQRDGWGYRIGLGGFIAGGNNVVTVPFQINYLIGNHSSMFEAGAGTTFLSSRGDNKGKTWEFDKITGFIATATFGYRYQPEGKGINFRIAFVPLLTDQGFIPAGGVSIGYNFK